MEPVIPEKIGLLLVIIRNCQMKLAAGIPPVSYTHLGEEWFCPNIDAALELASKL